MRSYKEYLERKKEEFGKKFNPEDLNQDFVPYYENQARIEVEFQWGKTKEILRGRVGVTTGWKPVFLLMKTVRSYGSSDLLTKNTKFLRVIQY